VTTVFDKKSFRVKVAVEAGRRRFNRRAEADHEGKFTVRRVAGIQKIMKRFSKLLFGVWSAAIGGALVLATAQFSSQGRETNAPPQIKLEQTPIERESRGVNSYSSIVKRAAPSVVNIYSTRVVREREINPFFNGPFFHFFGPDDNNNNNNNNNDDDQQQGQGNRSRRRQHSMKSQSLGSGVIVSSDGYILTANHVVAGAEEIRVVLASGGQEYKAKVIGADQPTDVAVLKISGKELPTVTIADSDRLEVGDVVMAIGNPFGVGQTVTMGIVSALGRSALGINDYEDFIQTDAAINPGNSGGALVDAQGRLIGINTAIFSESGGYQGVGFAVPVNLARNIMERLIKYGKVTRGYLGVGIKSLTPDLAEAFNMPDETGALVNEIRPNTPAAKAGLQNGDVIREIDGKKVTDSAQLRLTISETAPGTKVTLKYLRSENDKKPEEHTTTVVLGTLPGQTASNEENTPSGGGGSSYDSLDGVEVADIDTDARQQYGIPSNVRGAVVTSVDENSNAAEAGLQQGDVVQEINREPVRNADDAVKLSDKAHGKRVLLRVWTRTGGQGGSTYITVDNTKKK
jgi:serine protease Do